MLFLGCACVLLFSEALAEHLLQNLWPNLRKSVELEKRKSGHGLGVLSLQLGWLKCCFQGWEQMKEGIWCASRVSGITVIITGTTVTVVIIALTSLLTITILTVITTIVVVTLSSSVIISIITSLT